MDFQWTTDLNASNAIQRGPSLYKETDMCILAFERLKTSHDRAASPEDQAGFRGALNILRASIESRIEQLEDFYLQHDTDGKAILFEKQRLKLRRLLQLDGARPSPARFSPPPPPPSGSANFRRKLMGTPQQRGGTPGQRGSPGLDGGTFVYVRMVGGKNVRIETQPSDTVASAKLRVQDIEGIPCEQQRMMYQAEEPSDQMKLASLPNGAVLKLSRPAPKMAYSTNTSPRDKFASSVHKKRTKDRKKVAPIYDWEKGSRGASKVEKVFEINAPFTFQIKMTEKEFFKLTSRRRAIRAEKKHKERNAASATKESPYLQSTGPYVDPTRISSSIYRSPDKKKWINARGLRPYQHL